MHSHDSLPPRRRPRRVATAAGVCTVLVALASAGSAGAGTAPRQDDPVSSSAPLALPAPDLPGLPNLSADLTNVAVEGGDFRDAAAEYDAADASYAAQRDARTALDFEAPALGASVRRLRIAAAAAEARAASASARYDAIERAIEDLLVEVYIGGQRTDPLEAALINADPDVPPYIRRRVLAGASLETLLNERDSYRSQRDDAAGRAEVLLDELALVEDRVRTLADDRPTAESGEVAAAAELADRRVDYEAARVLAGVQGVDFPLVALDAYHRAAATMEVENPACGIQWWAIAGISRVEGRHGTFGGSSLDEFGDTTKLIIGIPLNGKNNTAVITDTDDGTLDGDPVHDRAVGPMQFIPSTWARFASDGDDDGDSDPHNLYDAALAAGRYLCRASNGLTADPALRTAYFSYNHSQQYVSNVLGYARGYEVAVDIPPVS